MKPFKFRDYVFTNLFGYRYHKEDTYKDANGQGILERFLLVCSEYFDDEVMEPIDNIVDLIDADKTPEQFIPLLWEYFGFIPYAYGLITIGKPYNQSDLAKWTSKRYPVADYRSLLRYAISLYKIRCTSDFYIILGKFYNIQISITESDEPEDESPSKYNDEAIYDDIFDYDQDKDCLQCVKMLATVRIPVDTYDYLVANGLLESATEAILALLNKYLPIHVRAFTEDSVTITKSDNPILAINKN